MNSTTQEARSTPANRVLQINGRSFLPFSQQRGEGNITGYYQQKSNGILLFNEAREPFVFVVANARQGYFFVSCWPRGKEIWYMQSTTSSDEKRLGLDALGYADECRLAESLPKQLSQPEVCALPEGWTEARRGGLATNADPENGGIIDQAIVTREWFVVFHQDGLKTLDGFATRDAAFEAFHCALGKLPTT